VKYDVARRIAPRSICEIGVRAGYSAFAFLSAAPQAEYLGLDIDGTDHGGERGFFDYARGVLAGFRATLTRADTQQLDRLPGRYDLVHVDGDHTQAGCRHDLELACRAAPHVLVDDCDFIPEVRRACDEFAVAHPELSVEYIDDGARGSLVFAARSDQSGRNR
jgi:hypothetical protein